MTEKIEYKGYWWRPTSPEKPAPGIMTYIPHEELRLELTGDFDQYKGAVAAFMEPGDEEIIHGLTSDAEKVTLVNCFSSKSINFSCPFPMTKYNCQYAVIGKHIDNLNQDCFYKAYVHFPIMSLWCHPGAIQFEYSENSKGKIGGVSISFSTDKKIIDAVDIDENTSLELRASIEYESDSLAPKIRQSTFLKISKQQDSNIKSFCSDIFIFEQFLSLASLASVQCSDIFLYDKTVYQETEDGDRHHHPIRLLYRQMRQQEDTAMKRHDILFDYSSISGIYHDIIRRWYKEKADLAPIRAHLVDSIAYKRTFCNTDFLVVMQAAEGFWWRFRDKGYKERNNLAPKHKTKIETAISELKKEFDDIGIIKEMDIDAKAAADSRNYYSHFMSRPAGKSILDGVELYSLTARLRLLLICCLLSFIGMDNSRIEAILKRSTSRFITEATQTLGDDNK